jgi:probable HAF family extracellular repeat protein
MRWSLLALGFTLVSSAGADTREYFLTPRNVPAGANSIEAINAINEAGDAVGSAPAFPSFISMPILWRGSTGTKLPNIGGVGSFASTVLNGINNVGGICGAGYNASNVRRGIYWFRGAPSELVPLGNPLLGGQSEALAVNDAADIAGISQVGDESGDYHATLWHGATSSPVDLGTLTGGTFSEAVAVSASSEFIAGSGTNAHGDSHAVLWHGGKAADLGTLGGPGSAATGVNDAGQVAGTADTSKFESGGGVTHYFQHAAIWQAGKVTDLGTLGGLESSAMAINSSGQVVGSADMANSNDPPHATLWEQGKIIDLNPLINALPANVIMRNATAIADDGKIEVEGPSADFSQTLYYLLTPAIATHTAIRSDINASSYGQKIHLIATIAPDSGPVPQGEVTWYDGAQLLGTARLTPVGTASWEPANWSVGTHNVTAAFGISKPDGSSTSPVYKQTVTPTVTKTALSTSANTVTHGSVFILTATVIPEFSTIEGTVTFESGKTTLGTATVDGRTKQARLTTTLKAAGRYSIAAVYGGTTHFRASTSAPLSITVK